MNAFVNRGNGSNNYLVYIEFIPRIPWGSHASFSQYSRLLFFIQLVMEYCLGSASDLLEGEFTLEMHTTHTLKYASTGQTHTHSKHCMHSRRGTVIVRAVMSF